MYEIPEAERQKIRGAQAGSFQPLADGEVNPFLDPPRGRPYNVEIALTDFTSERQLADRVLARLEPWFIIEREVRGTHCCGSQMRIDAIIRPREARQWADPEVALGLELKLPPKNSGEHAYTRWIAQAVDYTHVNWDGFGPCLIFTCPGSATWLDEHPRSIPLSDPNERREVHIAKRMAGQLNVGELVLRWANGLSLLFNGENVWSERYDVSKGKYWRLGRKVGSR